MILNLWNDLEKFSNDFKNWIIEESSPALMVGLFVGLLLIFTLAWNFVHKHHD